MSSLHWKRVGKWCFEKFITIKELIMEKLFIIGNGFDLAHGLKTSYLEFKNFVYQQICKSQVNVELDEIPEIKNVFFNDFEIPTSITGNHGEELYNDQEVAEKYFELISLMVKDKRKWIDFENSLARIGNIEFELNSFYDAEGDLDYSQTAAYVEDFSETLKNFYQYATNSLFSGWINTISKSEEYERLLPVKESVLNSKEVALYLTFNYTMVLEDKYGIKEEDIFHIHGSIRTREYLVGHNVEEEVEEDFNPFSLNSYIASWVEAVRKPVKERLESNAMKNFLERISDVTEIYFIGFNLEEKESPDKLYFQRIFKILPNVKVFIDEFSKDKEKPIKKTLKEWGLKNYESIEFIKT